MERDLTRPLAKLEIHSLREYNELLWKKLEKRLAEDFSKRIGSRTSIFLEEEKDNLLPLPVHEYQSIKKGKAIVGRDFHIQWSKAFYSVPEDHIGDNVRIEDDGFTVRIKTWDNVESATAVHTGVYATKGLKTLIEREKAKKEEAKPKKKDVDLNDIYYTNGEGGGR